jgi:hypothetical protein
MVTGQPSNYMFLWNKNPITNIFEITQTFDLDQLLDYSSNSVTAIAISKDNSIIAVTSQNAELALFQIDSNGNFNLLTQYTSIYVAITQILKISDNNQRVIVISLQNTDT